MRTVTPTIVKFFFAVLLFCSSATLFLIRGQQNPVERETQVTAIVSDLVAPSTPILIDPTNGEKLKTGDVDFIWKASTDNWLMDHYTYVLNGSDVYTNLPLVATTSAQYVLTYDSGTEYYTLDPTSNLADGSYTWKIIAWDYHGNSTSSVTWSFTIDTQAPVFTITTIENQTVEITTQDADSVPSDAIELEDNEPTLSGTGEANSSVHLTIRYENGDQEEQTFTIDGNGNWEVTLGELKRDTKILLDFLITDPSGNVSILSDVPLILYTPVIEVPVPAVVPTIPGIIREVPTEAPVEEPEKVLEIPLLPPKEYIPLPTRRKAVYYVRNSLATVREETITGIQRLLQLLLLLVLLVLPISKLAILQGMYHHYSSGQLIKEFFWFIGWWRKKNPQGIVLEKKTQKPVPHALVLVSGKTSDQRTFSKTLITNDLGIFPHIALPEGEFRISVHHPDYFFPTLDKIPQHLAWNSFYIGAPYTVKNGTTLPPFVLPVEHLKKQENALVHQVRSTLLLAPSASWPLGVISVLICLAFPSLINWITLAVYGGIIVKKWLEVMGKKVQIETNTLKKDHIPQVVIGIQKEDTRSIEALVQTETSGSAYIKLPTGRYKIWSIDFTHHLVEGDDKTTTAIAIETTDDYIPLVMD